MGLWSTLLGLFAQQPPVAQRSPVQRQPPVSPQQASQPFFDAQGVPVIARERLAGARDGTLPWVSTLTASEMALARTHGLKMIAPIAATCWMHYGRSWTEGHLQGWRAAQERLQAEAAALGANAVIDVKMVTVSLEIESSMDYSLVGTAVRIADLPPAAKPILSTVPALEFIQLLEAGIIPVGLAIGAKFAWSRDNLDIRAGQSWRNTMLPQTTAFWESIRRAAHRQLREDTARQGRGVLAQVNFGQIFRRDYDDSPSRYNYLGRHIVIGTVIDGDPAARLHQPIEWVLDLNENSRLTHATSEHHNSYSDSI